MSFSENVKMRRCSMGLTQGELADKCNLTFGQISKIERGIGNPKLDTIEKLMMGLGCEASDLIVNENVQRSTYANELLSSFDRLNKESQDVILKVNRALISQESIFAIAAESKVKEEIEYENYLEHLEKEHVKQP